MFRGYSQGFRVQGLWWDSVYGVKSLGVRVWGLGFRVQGLWWDSVYGVKSLGVRV